MAHFAGTRRPRRSGHGLLFGPFLLLLAVMVLAAGYVAYALWPRWPGAPVSLGSPPLPIAVAGVMFNIEPAAIRRPMQRSAGTQDRIDLDYLWPSLTPPDPALKPDLAHPVDPNQRLFVTIADSHDGLAPLERIKTIYPRYLAETADAGPPGLTVRPFRESTPYQGEDLIYDPTAPDEFVTRCSRSGIGNSGMCLYERRIGKADLTVRFPRDWLADWQSLAVAINRLIARLHPE